MSRKDNSGPNEKAASPGVRHVTVDAGSAGQRIDNFVAAELKGVPRGRIYRALRRGEVRLNGGRVKQTVRVAAGDTVRLPPVTVEPRQAARPGAAMSDALRAAIVFEDKRVLVINKPSGMAVHGGSGVSSGVVEALRTMAPEWRDVGLVHRLDRETSGCLVLAKRRSALRELHAAFREGRVSKRYLAGSVGHWPHGTMTVDAPLEVRHRQGGERHVVVAESGKPAATRFAPQAFYDGFTVLSAEPVTGRTHQIRVHALAAGHALALDERYGDPDDNERLRGKGLKRLFLHAQSIAFADASGNERLFTAPLPDDLARFVDRSRRLQP
ncbi:MAG: RluA family pseudouridine synthase [Pseudomonadota bacterium]